MPRLALVLTAALLLSGAAGAAAASPFDVEQDSRTVARVRGQRFDLPVVRQSMSRTAFRFYLKRQLERGANLPLDRFFEVLGALQLIERDTSVDSILDLYEGQVLAFYDPESHKYFEVTPPPADLPSSPELTRLVTIHELTHALQDQKFNAGKKLDSMRNDWDAQMAYQSVLEGEATLVMFAAMFEAEGQPLAEALATDDLVSTLREMAASNAGIDSRAPRYFVESMKFPYVQGVAFAIEAFRRGGWKELDRVHANPPVSTAQLIDPTLYFGGKSERAPAPPAPKNGILSTTLGRFHWQFLLGEGPAKGWAGDRVTVSEPNKGNLAVAVDSTWKSPEDASHFARSYADFLRGRGLKPKVVVEGSSVHVDYTAGGKP